MLPAAKSYSEAGERPKRPFWRTQQVSLEPKFLIEFISYVCDLRAHLHTQPRTHCTHQECFSFNLMEILVSRLGDGFSARRAHTGCAHTHPHTRFAHTPRGVPPITIWKRLFFSSWEDFSARRAHTGHTHTCRAHTHTARPHGIRQQACRKRVSGFGWMPDPGSLRSRARLLCSLASLSRNRFRLKAVSARDPGKCRQNGSPQGEAGPLRLCPRSPNIRSSRRIA